MLSKRILHAASALSVAALSLKKAIPKNNSPEAKSDFEKTLFPALIIPKVHAQPNPQGNEPDREGEFANAIEKACDEFGIILWDNRPGHYIVPGPQSFAFYNDFKKRFVFSVERLTLPILRAAPETMIRKHKLPDYFYPHARTGGWFQRRMKDPMNFNKDVLSFLLKAAPSEFKPEQKKVMEWTTKKVVDSAKEAIIVSGPLYVEDDQYLQYTRMCRITPLDKSNVEIPSHFFYIIILRGNDGVNRLYSFLIENCRSPNLDRNKSTVEFLEERMCPVQVIEHYSDHRFFNCDVQTRFHRVFQYPRYPNVPPPRNDPPTHQNEDVPIPSPPRDCQIVQDD